MKLPNNGRREFLQRAFAIGMVSAAAPYVLAQPTEAQNPPPPPPEPSNTNWMATIVSSGEPGDRLIVAGRVFAPDGQHTVSGVIVYAYNTDKDGYYSPDGKVGHPRLKGYMKTDADGHFELHTILP